MSVLTFDWSQIAYIVSPLATPCSFSLISRCSYHSDGTLTQGGLRQMCSLDLCFSFVCRQKFLECYLSIYHIFIGFLSPILYVSITFCHCNFLLIFILESSTRMPSTRNICRELFTISFSSRSILKVN